MNDEAPGLIGGGGVGTDCSDWSLTAIRASLVNYSSYGDQSDQSVPTTFLPINPSKDAQSEEHPTSEQEVGKPATARLPGMVWCS